MTITADLDARVAVGILKCPVVLTNGSIVNGWLICMDIKIILIVLSAVFTVACLFFGTRNGFYDSDNYHGNGSAH
ncbi:MAG: hypothetical protein AAFY67_02910 [Cyanobacteria bacterium J06642_9]